MQMNPSRYAWPAELPRARRGGEHRAGQEHEASPRSLGPLCGAHASGPGAVPAL